jgi:DNA-binding response OmpR family regulator
MKILIAEDDPGLRAAVARVTSHIADVVLEAENGLQALEIIQREDPDLLITDLRMPIIDGFEVIGALRASSAYRRMPVICLSIIDELSDVARLASLGISDYLLKPMKALELTERIRRVMRMEAKWRNDRGRVARKAAEASTLLVIDPDPNFRAFMRPLLEADFDVSDAASAAEGLVVYSKAEVKPSIVLVAEGLDLIDECAVAELLGRIASDNDLTAPAVFLLADHDDVAPEKAAKFEGIVRRSFVPEHFATAVRHGLPRLKSSAERIKELLTGDSHLWLVSATRQTLGVLSSQDVSVHADADDMPPTVGVSGTIEIVLPGADCRMLAFIGCSPEHATTLASAVLRRAATLSDGGTDVLGEFVNTIGGRVKASLVDGGFPLKLGLPVIATTDVATTGQPWDTSVWLRTTGGEDFFVALRVIDESSSDRAASPRPIASSYAANPPLPEFETVPADSESELDSVLF